MGQLKTVAISSIRENEVALRTVDRQGEGFLGLVESIRQVGVMNAITARERKDAETGELYLELIDGLHRFTASKEAGLTEIPVNVIDLKEDQILEAQIMANIHRIETKPVEYSQQLKRILNCNPMMASAELAGRLGKSPAWINDRLSLNKITNPDVAALIDEGKIVLANAYSLAKLPESEQADYVERAITLKPEEFVQLVQTRMKEIREAKRQGGTAAPAEFQPVAHLQKMSDLKAAVDNKQFVSKLVSGISDPVEAALQALKWALHLDPASVEAAKAADAARKQAAEEAKARKKAERDAAKAEEAKAAGSKL